MGVTSMAQSDRTVTALRTLAGTFAAAAAELQGMAGRSAHLAGQLEAGATLDEVMGNESRPLIITRLTQLSDRLIEAGAEVRRAEAHQLREEGYTQDRIAETFGVTRQRVSALLKPRPTRRGPYRPALGHEASGLETPGQEAPDKTG